MMAAPPRAPAEDAAASVSSTLASLERRAAERTRAGAVDPKSGAPVMSAERLALACKEHGGYSQPALNDSLYLHFVGFRRIENLEPYTALRALWLESNGLHTIEGLSHLAELRCLYLQNNLFARVGGGLAGLASLQTLNLSNNSLTEVEGLACLPALASLNLARNALASAAAIAHLTECAALATLDLSENELPGDDANEVIETLARVPRLANCVLKGNPVCRSTRHYRKVAVTRIARLAYLDDRPVFAQERAAVSAWMAGGAEGERAAMAAHEQRQRDAQKEGVVKFEAWQRAVVDKRAKELAELNAERAARGEAPLAHLPVKSQVSYTHASTRYVTEAILLKRVTEAAERAYREGGTGTLDLDGVRYAEGGIVDAQGNLCPQHEGEGAGGSGGGSGGGSDAAAAPAGDAAAADAAADDGEENAQRYPQTEAEEAAADLAMWEDISRREREAREAREAREGVARAAEQSLVAASLRMYNERTAAALAAERKAAARAARLAAAGAIGGEEGEDEEGGKEAEGEEEDEEEEEPEDEGDVAEREMEAEFQDKVARRLQGAKKEWGGQAADLLASISRAKAAREEGEGGGGAKVFSMLPAAAAAEPPPAAAAAAVAAAVAAAAAPAQQPAVATEPASGSDGSAAASAPSPWFPALDAALLKLTQQASFDFSKVSRGLKNALLRGIVKLPGAESGPPPAALVQACAEQLDDGACRERHLRLVSGAAAKPAAGAAADAAAPQQAPAKQGVKGFAERVARFERASVERAEGYSSAAADRMVAAMALRSTRGAENKVPAAAGAAAGSEDAEAAAPVGAVKPVAALLQGDFALSQFREYVRAPLSLPSMGADEEDEGEGEEGRGGGGAGTADGVSGATPRHREDILAAGAAAASRPAALDTDVDALE